MFERVLWGVFCLAIFGLVIPARADEEKPLTAAAEKISAQANGVVRLVTDFARPITLMRPANTVIIGNSGIVQVSLSDDRTLVITGKMPGTTNLIVLDNEGEEVTNLVVDVSVSDDRLVIVHQGMGRATFKCDGSCNPILAVGDDAEHFDRAAVQLEGRSRLSAPPDATQ